MVMNTNFIFFVCFFGYYSLVAKGNTNCDTLGINFYDDIGCPRENNDGDCPSYDNCKYKLKRGKCLYNGKVLENGQSVPLAGVCYFACICDANNNSTGKFVCAQGQCGILPPNPSGVECYREYTLDHCCGIPRCEPSATTCEVDGITYKEGEKFFPKDECSVCICTSDFDGKYNGPHCKRRPCGTEILHSADIARNCAPVYYKRSGEDILCCPNTFICPSHDDKIIKSENGSPELTCKYGHKTVKSGFIFTRNVDQYGKTRKVTCECKLPPLLTCTADY